MLVVDQSAQAPEWIPRLQDGTTTILSGHRPFTGLPQARNYGWQRARYRRRRLRGRRRPLRPSAGGEHLRTLTLPGVGLVAGGIGLVRSIEAKRRPNRPVLPLDGTPHQGFDASGECDVDHAQGCNFSAGARRRDGRRIRRIAERRSRALRGDGPVLRVKRAGYRIRFNGAARLTHLAAAGRMPRGGCPRVRARPRP